MIFFGEVNIEFIINMYQFVNGIPLCHLNVGSNETSSGCSPTRLKPLARGKSAKFQVGES
jgi:hypothetical protein